MGDIADMMINGDLCQVCGSDMGEGDGFSRTCCESNEPEKLKTSKPIKTKCDKNTVKKFFRNNEDIFNIHFEIMEAMKGLHKNTLLVACIESQTMKAALAKQIRKTENYKG